MTDVSESKIEEASESKVENTEDNTNLENWIKQAKETREIIKELKALNISLQTRVQDLEHDLLEAGTKILQIELSNKSQIDQIEQFEIEEEEAEDEITEPSSGTPKREHRTSVHRSLPVTSCARHPPRKSIINFLI